MRFVFVLSPLHFGVASFFMRVFLFWPLAFWGYLFSHRWFFFLSPCILGLPLLSSEIFLFQPIAF
jgi:hypothetical protein